MNDQINKFKSNVVQSLVVLVTIMAIVATVFCTQAFAGASSEEIEVPSEEEMTQTQTHTQNSEGLKYALVAAAVAFGLGAIGAGIAISHVGAAAMGAVAEKPQIAGQALIFVALAEGIVVFGFITALMILGKV